MEEQGLVVVKDNFLIKIKRTLKRFFFKGKMKNLLIEEKATSASKDNDIETVQESTEFVQHEIIEARRAYRKYVINNNKDLAKNVFEYINNKMLENEYKIKKLIEINNDDITYHDIITILNEEEKNIDNFKKKNSENGYYSVPVGVVGVECDNVKDSIRNIFKAISTRNSVIILHDKFSKYSTESLILLIVKECLKNFYIDDNIVQMLNIIEIDLNKLDKFIPKEGIVDNSKTEKCIYIYQENDEFHSKVEDEIQRLKNDKVFSSYEIKPIKGEFGNVINYLNDNNASAVCMYTNNDQKAYKFINWVNSGNVFVNTGIKNCQEIGNNSEYFNSKYVLYEDVF